MAMATPVTTTGTKRARDRAGPAAAAEAPRSKKKRKRSHRHEHTLRPHEDAAAHTSPAQPTHAVLSQYYTRLRTLRDHVLESLPLSSRLRRRKIASLGKPADNGSGHQGPPSCLETAVSHLLDSTVVASSRDHLSPRADDRWHQWLGFSQRGDESYVSLSDGATKTLFCQSEIVNFVIWSLFEKDKNGSWPKNVLCDGFRRGPAWGANPPPGGACPLADSVPGLSSVYPNQRVRMLKESFWPELLGLLGQAGERLMIDLLLDHSVFVSVSAGSGNYYQLSGKSLNDLEPPASDRLPKASCPSGSGPDNTPSTEKSPAEIVFVRSRMLYSRAALNAQGAVHFGLRHIHVLNRYPFIASECPAGAADGEGPANKVNRRNTSHCMMYMFPRQFALHNAFTSTVDRAKTAQKFQDYTLREDEIKQKPRLGGPELPPVPKRLRGSAYQLVQKLQILHKRCSYSALLHYYCPASRGPSTASPCNEEPGEQTSVTLDLSSPVSHVSAYCQAVLSKIIPNGFWGAGQVQADNKKRFLKHVDHFVKLRRFETMSLHELKQGFKIAEIGWLAPPGFSGKKTSQTDMRKRTEIFLEFLYYLFDSLLMPLIRSNFYVTESSSHRSKLFYFRHDVWRSIAEPAMSTLKDKMFEEVRSADAQRILASRDLGCSQVRLLPKEAGMRPITNLRRRAPMRGNKKVLGPSINSVLGPVHSVLKLEKDRQPSRLGSSMLSVGDLYLRLKAFKERQGTRSMPFFFAKVDVQAAFDTVPQAAILRLMADVPSLGQYKVIKHVEVEAESSVGVGGDSMTRPRMSKRWRSVARDVADGSSFMDMLMEKVALSKKETVFVDSVVQKTHKTGDLIRLLAEHIGQNLIRIGKKHYRQKTGIPQGSILSSLLCNYFYADLESKHLSFLKADDCLLLRLIDDFLLITTDRDKASRFVEVMHKGVPEYGVAVNPGKTLVNFVLACDGVAVPRPEACSRGEFPYCGTLINCASLGIKKDRARPRDPAVANSLTVDFSRHQGQNFQRKVVNAFKIQSHLMFFDTAHNSRRAALRNLAGAMAETATKTWAYIRCLPPAKRPRPRLVAAAIDGVANAAYALLTSKSRKLRFPGYTCDIRREQVRGVTLHAFKQVLAKRQSCFGDVLAWLETEIQAVRTKNVMPELDG